jgi:hypothetical protein
MWFDTVINIFPSPKFGIQFGHIPRHLIDFIKLLKKETLMTRLNYSSSKNFDMAHCVAKKRVNLEEIPL